MGEWVHGLIVKVRRQEAKDFFAEWLNLVWYLAVMLALMGGIPNDLYESDDKASLHFT